MPQDPRRQELIASLLADRYEIVQFLGEGGFATVYQVVNPRLKRVEALKVLHADHTEEPDFAKRFEQEARVAASLDHPNIVKIYDYGHAHELFWFTMQFVDGPTLVRSLKASKRLDAESSLRIGVAVLDALDYSHRRGIIHRDIKPENIILDADRRPYLMDFGIAKSEGSVVKTRTGTVLGSPAYIAPEQLTGAVVDGRADIFAFGVTMYRMLSGGYPFFDEDPFRMATKRLTMAAEPLVSKLPGIDSRVEAAVMRALEREPEKRFASAGEMRDALYALLPEGIPARGPSRSVSIAPLPPAIPEAGLPSGGLASRSRPVSSMSAARSPTAAAWPEDLPDAVSFASMPTIRTVPPGSGTLTGRWRFSARWTVMTVVLIAAVAGGITILATRRPAPEGPTQDSAVPSPEPASGTAAENPEAATPAPQNGVGESETAVPSPVPEVPSPAPVEPNRKPERPTPRPNPPAELPGERIERMPPDPIRARKPVTQPETESEVPLEISSELAERYANQNVVVSLTVTEDGRAKDLKVRRSVCPECDQAALEAVRRYRFKPARDAQGRPVDFKFGVIVTINPQ